ELANIIITSVDQNGFTNENHDTIALSNGFSRKESSQVVEFFLGIEPRGVCARDIWQSLEWQAKFRYPGDMVLLDLIAIFQQGKKEIQELDSETLQDLEEYLKIPSSQIMDAIQKIKSLEMNPAVQFKVFDQNYIFPEIIYSVKNDTIQINFSNPLLPDVTLNDDLLSNLQNDKNIKMWKLMYHDAKNLIKSIEFRKSSMIKVAKIIALRQKLYFLKGEKYLKPMNLKDVAQITQLNISTVSRIMKNKYCITPYGIFPLAYFLVKKMKSVDSENLSAGDLKKSIMYIIEHENHTKPLSDILIAEKLHEFGFNIQRRTVTKYRKLLHIPSAKQRTVLH
ncbi:MAG: hypothetical protein OEV66_10895, partial [Spirochaetia bacterium]|nr:hypothetical protein [Spirochaetia bacterium]